MNNVHRLSVSAPQEEILTKAFPRKEQVKIGTQFICYGRRDPGARWRCTRIQSYFTTTIAGNYKLLDVEQVRHLSDILTLERRGTGETRTITFGSLSYMAPWWLA